MAPTGEGQAQAQNQSSGSFWMPLMAGYMMGRMMSGGMGGYQQQPVFTSKKTHPARPTVNTPMQAVKTTAPRSQVRSMNVPKTAMAPRPATTSTVTRGGFGESVAKQSTMQRSATGSTSRSIGTD